MIFSFVSCDQKADILNMDTIHPNEIKIINLKTGQEKILSGEEEMKNFMKQLEPQEKELVKFKPSYRIEIILKNNKTLLFLYADGYIKYQRISYKLKGRIIM